MMIASTKSEFVRQMRQEAQIPISCEIGGTDLSEIERDCLEEKFDRQGGHWIF